MWGCVYRQTIQCSCCSGFTLHFMHLPCISCIYLVFLLELLERELPSIVQGRTGPENSFKAVASLFDLHSGAQIC